MENVTRETIKLPKWVIVLMALAFLIIPFGSASAAEPVPPKLPSDLNGRDYTLLRNSVGSWWIIVYGDSNSYLYKKADGGWAGVGTGAFMNNQYDGGDWGPISSWTWGLGQPFGAYSSLANSQFTIHGSTVDVYTDSSKSGVFFSKPAPPPPPPPPPAWEVEKVTVEQIPEAIILNLRGGLLGLGLTILALMLGVSLVPRLIHYFNR